MFKNIIDLLQNIPKALKQNFETGNSSENVRTRLFLFFKYQRLGRKRDTLQILWVTAVFMTLIISLFYQKIVDIVINFCTPS